MLAEALDVLKMLSTQAAEPKVLPTIPGASPGTRYIYLPAEKRLQEINIDRPPRSHVVDTLDSFRAAVETFSLRPTDPLYVLRPPVLWVSMSQVVAVFDDDAFRTDRTTLVLKPSSIFDELDKSDDNQQGHKEFCRFLRHTLAEALYDPENLVDIVRAVKFSTGSETASEITQGKNTLGRSVMREVTGTIAIPEDVVVTFEPWPASDIFPDAKTVSVECSLFTDAADETFELAPKPGQIAAAMSQALDALRSRVAEVTGLSLDRVLAGKP